MNHYTFNFKRATNVALLFCITACSLFAKDAVFGAESKVNSQKNIQHQIDSVMAKLSVREKVAQLFIIDFASTESARRKQIQNKLVKNEKIGGVIAMNDKLIPAMERLNELNKIAAVPLLVTIDGEWGASMRFKEIPPFPRQMQLGALDSDTLVFQMGYLIGKECKDLKFQVNFAPDVDINNNPNNPAVNTRSFGEDKQKVARYGAAYSAGMAAAGVAGSAKHFPGHGDTDVDSHKALPILPFDYARLDSLELFPFRYLINSGVDMVMVGHLEVPALDSSGTPSSISKPIITDYLRNKLGYKGIICTDALNMDGVAKSRGLEKKMIPLEAYKAGADILLMAEDVENAITEIEKRVKNGQLSLDTLNLKVRKMLALKARMGLFDKYYSPLVNIKGIEERVVKKENVDLINKLAKNSITLVFNDNSTSCGIPVSTKNKKIAYFGYKGENFSKEFAMVAMRYAKIDTLILRSEVTLKDLQQAKEALKSYDLIITGFNNTDFRPQRNFGIDTAQMNFITDWAAGQPMIAVYFGSPYALGRIKNYKNFTAFVLGYTNTLANNFAAAQLVFGGIPSRGVLPVCTDKFKVGESVIIKDRFREELFEFIGTKKDSLMQVEYSLNNLSALLSVVPAVGELINSGKIKEYSTLGDLLDLPLDRHNHILLSDLLMQRSGIPQVDSTYILNTNSVVNLRLKQNVLPEFSVANVFYLNKIVNEYNPYLNIRKFTEQMFDKLGMTNSYIMDFVPNHNKYKMPSVISTDSDLAKFKFMIENNGMYGGERVLSPYTASLIKMLFIYY